MRRILAAVAVAAALALTATPAHAGTDSEVWCTYSDR